MGVINHADKRVGKSALGRWMRRAIAFAVALSMVLAMLPCAAYAKNFDEMFVGNFVTLSRDDDDGYGYEPVSIILTVTYNNDVLARAEERQFEWEKYLQLRLETSGEFDMIDPHVLKTDSDTVLRYSFDIENGRSAALWIVEDLHKGAIQPSMRIVAVTPEGAELDVIGDEYFHSTLTKSKTNDWFLENATVALNESDKAGIPNAKLKLKVQPIPEAEPPVDGENGEDAPPPCDDCGDSGNGKNANPPVTAYPPTDGVIRTGDAVVLVGVVIMGVSLAFIIAMAKRRKEA